MLLIFKLDQQLGRNVLLGARNVAVGVYVLLKSEPEVSQLVLPPAPRIDDQDVVGLDVPVEELPPLHAGQEGDRGLQEVDYFTALEEGVLLLALLDELGQGAVAEVEDEAQLEVAGGLVVVEEVEVELGEGGVPEGDEGLDLVERLVDLLIYGGDHQLEGVGSAVGEVMEETDGGAVALAELPVDPEVLLEGLVGDHTHQIDLYYSSYQSHSQYSSTAISIDFNPPKHPHYPHTLHSPYPHTLYSSYPVFPYPHALYSCYLHTLYSSYPNTLYSCYPHTLSIYQVLKSLGIFVPPEGRDLGDLDDSSLPPLGGLAVVLLKDTLDVSDGVLRGAFVGDQGGFGQVEGLPLPLLPAMVLHPPVPHLYQFQSKLSVDPIQFVGFLPVPLRLHIYTTLKVLQFFPLPLLLPLLTPPAIVPWGLALIGPQLGQDDLGCLVVFLFLGLLPHIKGISESDETPGHRLLVFVGGRCSLVYFKKLPLGPPGVGIDGSEFGVVPFPGPENPPGGEVVLEVVLLPEDNVLNILAVDLKGEVLLESKFLGQLAILDLLALLDGVERPGRVVLGGVVLPDDLINVFDGFLVLDLVDF